MYRSKSLDIKKKVYRHHYRIFVFDKELFSYLDDSSSCDFEFGPLQEITKDRQLKAFHHSGFWQCMDNVRERDYLNELIKQNLATWIIW